MPANIASGISAKWRANARLLPRALRVASAVSVAALWFIAPPGLGSRTRYTPRGVYAICEVAHRAPHTIRTASRLPALGGSDVEAEHHSALVVLGDVAVGHPAPDVGHVEQDVD